MEYDIKKFEKAKKTINIYPSTYDAIVENKGDYQISVFIDIAVKHYLKSMKEESEISKIQKSIDEIRDAVRTNLSLNCEVLKQSGLLNASGEVEIKKNI